MPLSPEVLILGTGAMACLFAAHLSAAGIPVAVLGSWMQGLTALRAQGVRLADAEANEQTYAVRVVTEPDECRGVRFALVLVKSWQTERAARQLQDCLHSEGLALSLQNGLGNRRKLAAALGAERVAVGVTTTGATLLGPGQVRSGGNGTITVAAHSHLQPFVDYFQQAGFAVERTAELDALIWGKLAINAAINPLTALLRVPNGELLVRPPSRRLMGLAAREVEAVATARGIQLPFDDVILAVEDVARCTSRNHSSMLQDVLRGAPTEIEAINGAIVQIGGQVGIPVPVNQTLYLLVKSMIGLKEKRVSKWTL